MVHAHAHIQSVHYTRTYIIQTTNVHMHVHAHVQDQTRECSWFFCVQENEELEADEDLQLAPGDVKYKTLEQMSEDIKSLDEVRMRGSWGGAALLGWLDRVECVPCVTLLLSTQVWLDRVKCVLCVTLLFLTQVWLKTCEMCAVCHSVVFNSLFLNTKWLREGGCRFVRIERGSPLFFSYSGWGVIWGRGCALYVNWKGVTLSF